MELLVHLLKSTAILSLFFVIYRLLLNKDTLFTAHRLYLLCGIVAALLLPFITFEQIHYILIPATQEMNYTAMDPALFTDTTGSRVAMDPVFKINWIYVALVTYTLGVSVMITRFMYQLTTLRTLIKSGKRISQGRYLFIEVSAQVTPCSFFQYIVYNPQSHQAEELAMILAHERVHARQWHSIDVLMMQATLCLQWYNPLAWLYKNDINENLEFLADHRAVKQVPSIKEYQHVLVKASSALQPALTTNFYQSFIKKRILMLNKPPSRKHNLLKLGLILPVLAVFMYSFNVKEVIEYVEEKPSETAFAKAETPAPVDSLNSGRDIFYIDEKSTARKLDAIENYVAKYWDDVRIKFDQKTFSQEGNLTAFNFKVKFAKDNGLINRFAFTNKTNQQWQGYNFRVNNADEIVFKEKEDGSLIKLTSDNIQVNNDNYNLETDPLFKLNPRSHSSTNPITNYYHLTAQSTKETLDQLEKTIATQFPKSKIRFSDRKFYDNGAIKRFSLQTKFEDDTRYHTRFKRQKDIHANWKGYRFEMTPQDEIIVTELDGGGTAFKIDIDKLSFLTDLPGTVYDRALVSSEKKYDPKNEGTYSRSPQDQPIAFTDSSNIKMSSVEDQDTYNFKITKDSTPEELDLLKQTLKEKHGAQLTIKNVDYNEKQEIVSIRLDFKDASGNNKNYTIQSSSPIADIYIYRDASGLTGMGNATSASDFTDQRNAMREQINLRREQMTSKRDSMNARFNNLREAQREQREARKDAMRARIEQTRSLQRSTQADSSRRQILQKRDSLRLERSKDRNTLGRGRNFIRSTSDKADAGLIQLNGKNYYYTKIDDTNIYYYTADGVKVQQGDSIYEDLVKASYTSTESEAKKNITQRLERYGYQTLADFDNAIYFINGKKSTFEASQSLDPDTIESVSVLKGKTAVRLYGKEAAKGAILIETKN